MPTVLDVWNTALSALRGKGGIAATTATTREADLCRIWYPIARDAVQRGAFWPSCRITAALTQLVKREGAWEAGDPEENYTYAYALPTDYLRARFLRSGERFSLALLTPTDGDEQLALHTDATPAQLVYSKKQEDVDLWDPVQFEATALVLASNLAGPLLGRPEREQVLLGKAHLKLQEAEVASANSESNNLEYVPDVIASRYGGGQAFYYPPLPIIGGSGEGVGLQQFPDANN